MCFDYSLNFYVAIASSYSIAPSKSSVNVSSLVMSKSIVDELAAANAKSFLPVNKS